MPRVTLILFSILTLSTELFAGEIPPKLPPWLPRYDLDIDLNLKKHHVHVRQRVTWTNRHRQPTNKLVFNAHSRYVVPKGETGFVAKTLELLRMNPLHAMIKDRVIEIQQVLFLHGPKAPPPADAGLKFEFAGDTQTAMIVHLPAPIQQGQSVTVMVEFDFRLPQKMGRWGQWEGVTFLSNWLPVLAYYDDGGWLPTPFIPWHQPFFNEAGIYHANITLSEDQVVGCSGEVLKKIKLPDGSVRLEVVAAGVRDFSFLCSARYREHVGLLNRGEGCPPLKIRVLAFPEHEFYARKMLQTALEAVPVYEKWFGRYPWTTLTIGESFFGWNGNECSTMIMIDERVFGMPHLADRYVDYLVSHEICHQWWYNVVGTNGYAETWMDESVATWASHRLITQKRGSKNDELMRYPKNLRWLPNIKRRNYRIYGLYSALGRGSNSPVVQEIPRFGHLANLFNMTYDKGSKIIGMIAERLGQTGFLDFMRVIYKKYQFRILLVKDYQRELEAYTGQSWQEFFQHWIHGEGLSDWAIKKVKVKQLNAPTPAGPAICPCGRRGSYEVTVMLKQKGKFAEQTTLGLSFGKKDSYPIRIPILPELPHLDLEDGMGTVQVVSETEMRVDLRLSCRPSQITVDPDQIIVDTNPTNNFWKAPIRWRFAPLYTTLEETDLTNAYDRWNVLFGPWIYRAAYDDPWYTRTTLIGARVGAYRTQRVNTGAYLAYRTDFRDVVAGVDGVLSNWPVPRMRLGFNAEQRLATFQGGRDVAFRGAGFARYLIQNGSSLYLPAFQYVESYGMYSDNFLPFQRNAPPDAQRFDSTMVGGAHYHLNYLTPYWDPSGGIQVDVTYAGGKVDLPRGEDNLHQVFGQVATVQPLPDLSKWIDSPFTRYLAKTRVAVRGYGAAATPDDAALFTMGGGTLFRGYDQAERQGSAIWIASVEWRMPLVENVKWDVLDHVLGARNVHLALFYDVGSTYVNGRSIDGVSHAVGAGLRIDVALFGFIERATMRFDVAKTVNDDTPMQFWVGMLHPF